MALILLVTSLLQPVASLPNPLPFPEVPYPEAGVGVKGDVNIHTKKPKLRFRPCYPGKSIVPPGHRLLGDKGFQPNAPPLSGGLSSCLPL